MKNMDVKDLDVKDIALKNLDQKERTRSLSTRLLATFFVVLFIQAIVETGKASSNMSDRSSRSSESAKTKKAKAKAKARAAEKQKQKAKAKTNGKSKIVKNSGGSQKRVIQSTITHKNLPIITSDIYLLEKVVSSSGAIDNVKDQRKVGRFITFSNFSSLSGFDGCHWFQQDYSFAEAYVKLAKKKMMEGSCSQVKRMEILPPSPFSIQYQESAERLTLTSQKTKQKYIYRKNVANAD